MYRNDGYWEPWVLCPTGKGTHCGECEYNYLCNPPTADLEYCNDNKGDQNGSESK